MFLETATVEKQNGVETKLLEQLKPVVLAFINEKYPEDSDLGDNGEIREGALAALKNLENADTIDVLYLQQALDVMAIFLRHLEKTGEQKERVPQLSSAHKAFVAYVQKELKK